MGGDDEQYAALLALEANHLGVPARVVFGAVPEASGTVKGSDIQAWVEVETTDGWQAITQKDFLPTHTKQPKQKVSPQKLQTGSEVPPVPPVAPPATTGDPLDDSVNQHAQVHHTSPLINVPGWVWALVKVVGTPVLVLLLICSSIMGFKAWRRRHRRTGGTPARRLLGAWRELVDHARDFGRTVPKHATRREQAGLLPWPGAQQLAWGADVSMFGEQGPTDEVVSSFWDEVDAARRANRKEQSRWSRVKAALSLSTFKPGGSLGR
jgi:hypothetical protein